MKLIGNGHYVAVSSSGSSSFLSSTDAVNWTFGQNAGGLGAAFHSIGYVQTACSPRLASMHRHDL